MRANRVKELRRQHKWTQQELSNITGIPRSTLGEIEIHMRQLKSDQIKALCKAFGLDSDERLFQ